MATSGYRAFRRAPDTDLKIQRSRTMITILSVVKGHDHDRLSGHTGYDLENPHWA
jgi:hypothetical protein